MTPNTEQQRARIVAWLDERDHRGEMLQPAVDAALAMGDRAATQAAGDGLLRAVTQIQRIALNDVIHAATAYVSDTAYFRKRHENAVAKLLPDGWREGYENEINNSDFVPVCITRAKSIALHDNAAAEIADLYALAVAEVGDE